MRCFWNPNEQQMYPFFCTSSLATPLLTLPSHAPPLPALTPSAPPPSPSLVCLFSRSFPFKQTIIDPTRYSRHGLTIDMYSSINNLFGHITLDGEIWYLPPPPSPLSPLPSLVCPFPSPSLPLVSLAHLLQLGVGEVSTSRQTL